MTEGFHRPLHLYVTCILVLATALLCVPLARAADWNLETLMHALAQRPAGRATYVETKTMAILNVPIKSSGELRYAAPDLLEMRTLKPRPQTLVVQGNQVSVEADGRRRQFSLRSHPEVAGLVDGIRATLNGNLRALTRDYRVTLEGDAARWSLTLVPLDATVRARVRQVRIGGRENWVRTIAVQQADGDHSSLIIQQHAMP
ncbi:MAG: LolA-related protein [Gammaproteobacteria bacterium]|nr:outer membrane lipoprotein carrier protein LolA [Gammaproteobacteria bacterium]